ncbi:MAG: DEAD/DEAH box helicase [Bacteroidales bacterium]|nr:DEAD/DEAH box helicase [Bacteroidales bacterium]
MEFILLLYTHRTFGWMIRPSLAAEPDPSGKRQTERFIPGVAETAGLELTEGIRRILELTASFSDQELTRRFAPKGITVAAFVKKPDEKRLIGFIRPFIDRQLDAILTEGIREEIPLYRAGDGANLYPDQHIALIKPEAIPWFHFSREETQTRYRLEVKLEDQPLSLRDPGITIITNDPCRLLVSRPPGTLMIRFPNGFDGKKLQPFLSKTELLIPASAEKEYFRKFILKMTRTGQVKAEGFSVETIPHPCRMELAPELNWEGRGVLVVWFRYGEHRILAGKPQPVFTTLAMEGEEIGIRRTERDFPEEKRQMGHLLRLGLKRESESSCSLPGSRSEGKLSLLELLEWLNLFAIILSRNDIMVDSSRLPASYFTGAITSSFRVEPGEDWFDISATVWFGTVAIPFTNLRHYLLEGIREFPLPGGEIAVLPAEWFTRFTDLLWYSVREGEKLRIPLRHFSLIRALDLPASADARQLLGELKNGVPDEFPVPDALQATLRPYQEEGYRWMQFLAEHRFGGCLADDMGLGKTIQAIAVILTVDARFCKASLVVMPASLIHNWVHELNRFAPSLRVWQHTGPQRATNAGFFDGVDLVLTTYGTMRSDIDRLSAYPFHYVILDEGQFIKNPDAQTSQAARSLQATHRLVLTGTPIENSLTDLWSQMEFLNPGMLGSLAAFKKRYLQLEKRIGKNSGITGRNKAGDENGTASGEEVVSENDEVTVRLKRMIAPFILRRTKQEVERDLPPLILEERICAMTPDQESRYEQERSAVRNEVLQQLESGDSGTTNLMVLRALIRLRQLANHPALVDPGFTGSSGKFDEVLSHLEVLREEGHKVLIFSSFVKHLHLFAQRFEQDLLPFSILTGASVHRDRIIREFREHYGSRFFLISLKAGGIGLNLTEASYVMMLDPWWNPAAELQAINRAHRIGQDNKVIAYKFITENTIEEKMLKLQQRKQKLSDTFIPSGNTLKDLTREELNELFR